jgi:SOS-response transcriptional repressor LexA
MSGNHCTRFPPTLRQLEALWHVREHQRARGYGISIRALCEALGLASTNAGADIVRALCRKELATKDELVARSLRVTPLGARFLLGFSPSAQEGRSRSESTGKPVAKIKASSQPVNNAGRGEGRCRHCRGGES